MLSSRDAARPPHLRLRLRSPAGAHRADAARAARREPAHGRRSRDGHDRASARSPTSPDLLDAARSARRQPLARRARSAARHAAFGSGAPAEIFLLSPLGGDRYEAMVSPGGKLKPGRAVEIAPGFVAEILVGHRATHAHRPASRRHAASSEAIERTATSRCRRTSRACDERRGRRAVSDGVRARSGLRRRADGGTALHPRAARTPSTRAASRAPRWCCTSAPARSSRSRSRIPPQHVMHEEWYTVPEETARRHTRARARPADASGRSARRPCARSRARRTTPDVVRAGSGRDAHLHPAAARVRAPSTRSSPTFTCRARR